MTFMRTFIFCFLLMAILFASIAVRQARADGGQICWVGTSGEYRLTVFVEPVPLRPGNVDLSVFVQDRKSLKPVDDLNILFTLRSIDPSAPPVSAEASRALATNQLFQAAAFELPTAGTWHVEMEVSGSGSASRHTFPLLVGPPRAPLWNVAPWILLPFIPIGLFLAGEIFRAYRDGQNV
jgi:hypothetical protein